MDIEGAFDNVTYGAMVGEFVSVDSSNLCVDGQSLCLTQDAPLKIGSPHLGVSSTVKYLGLTLDSKLTWNNHLNNALHKAKWALMTSSRFAGTTWGIKPHIALWLYEAVVRPQITYGSLVWWTMVNQITVIAKLESMQRLGTLQATGAFRSSPSATLEVALGLLPLDIFIRSEALKAAYRMRVLNLWRERLSGAGHCAIAKTLAECAVLDMTSDFLSKEAVFTKPFNVEFRSRDEWKHQEWHLQDMESFVWYTDGSLIDGKSGFGVYCRSPRTELSGSLGQYYTIFQAEIYGILACANLGLARRYQDKMIVILSDCQAALKALDSNEVTTKLVWECFNTLCRLASQNSVTLGWVPGHVGIGGNESADKLAKKEPSTPFTRWLLKLGGGQVKQVLALITGHGHFRKHLHTLGIVNDKQECRLCNQSDETAKHIILDCDGLRARRRALFGLKQPGDEPDANIGQKLLHLVRDTGIGLLS
ncbi:uncharacterized protein LOC128984372 [Macrosteles quadrilineatus]|uniref:uncharacterized protein LOC128984372 n=1 Tax=Macrosteles quadrilineatus TaxID=74068 RepID=UPI0023E0A660|nr:uncharacterized protein LOC128984372 [Macrosteles quadrilineatus]